MKKTWKFLKTHKKTSIAAVVIIVLGGFYYHSTHTTVATSYVFKAAKVSSVRTTVSGTGQVSSAQQVSVLPKVSGDVVAINVKDGDSVEAGQVLATLDSTNALFSLKNAQISLAKLQSSSPVSVGSTQNSLQSAQSTLDQEYSNTFNSIINSYNHMGSILTSLNDMFYTQNISPYFYDTGTVAQQYGQDAATYKQIGGMSLDKATKEYAAFRPSYVAMTQGATSSVINALNQELIVAQDLLQAVKNTSAAVNFIITAAPKANRTTAMTTDMNNLTNWVSTMNTDTTDLQNHINSLDSDTRALNQNSASYESVAGVTSPLDIQSAQLSLAQAEYTYGQYTIRAPFSGIVGNVTLRRGDAANTSSVIATVVTKDFISKISLNEVDAAKVVVGQPVNVTFNALSDVKATGVVSDVDTVGAVSQGVVSYNVVVSFHTDDTRVKAGMSINAEIVTAQKDAVLTVPNSAVKTVGGRSFVQVSTAGSGTLNSASSSKIITNRPVKIGLSDDTNTEIISGLTEGDVVVTQTIAGTATKTTAATQGNIFSSIGGGARGAATGGARSGAGAGR